VIRDIIFYDISELLEEFEIDNPLKIEFYVDKKNEKKISSFIRTNRKRFRRIIARIIQNKVIDDLYGPEPYGLKALKFKGSILNSRIYCKEFFNNGKKIVLIHLVKNKTSQKVNKRILQKLESISQYQYNFN
jgi:hypothetical protein